MLSIKIGSCCDLNEEKCLFFGARAAEQWKSLALIAVFLFLLGFVTEIGRAIRSRGTVCACFRAVVESKIE